MFYFCVEKQKNFNNSNLSHAMSYRVWCAFAGSDKGFRRVKPVGRGKESVALWFPQGFARDKK